jgi:ferric iron reductase protein FhuF
MSFIEPAEYSKSFSQLYLMLNTAILGLPDNFIKYKLNQTNNYSNNINNINNIRSDIFTKQQKLFSDNKRINYEIAYYNDAINNLNIENSKLMSILNKYKNTGLAADGELTTQKFLYKQYSIRYIILIFIILYLSLQIVQSVFRPAENNIKQITSSIISKTDVVPTKVKNNLINFTDDDNAKRFQKIAAEQDAAKGSRLKNRYI